MCIYVCVYIYMDICKWVYDETNYAICYILIKGRVYKEDIAILWLPWWCRW